MSYKFKVGDKGKTRDGKDYRVVCVDRKSEINPVIALTSGRLPVDAEQVLLVRSTGSCYEHVSHPTDLLPPTVTKWLNVCLDTDGTCVSYLYLTQGTAKTMAAETSFNYIIIAQPVEVQES